MRSHPLARFVGRFLLLDLLLDKQARPIFYYAGVNVVTGALLYHWLESWNLLDSIYFVIITLTTIGYGDFAPKTPVGKAFTMVYVFIGLGVLAMFISAVAEQSLAEQRKQRASKDASAGDSQGRQGQEIG